MPSLNIRVGASVDRNLQVAFQPLVESAKRARAAIEAESGKASRAIGKGVKKGTKDAEAAFAELVKEVSTDMPRAMNAGTAAVVKFGKEARGSFDETKRRFADMAREAERDMNRLASKKRATFGSMMRSLPGELFRAAGGLESIVSGGKLAGSLGLGLAKRAAGTALSVAKSLASGAGVELDSGAIFKKNFDIETMAQNLSNSSFIASDPRNNRRVDKQILIDEALSVGEKTGSDANVAIEGLQAFVSKTGDLRTGRDILETMAKYAKATGASLGDMLDAAGDVSNQLTGVQDKGKAISTLMQGFIGQGKLGAIEIRDLAVQMSKVGASASRFEGGQNALTEMGVLAQAARGAGGSASAPSAATAVTAFADTFSKKARVGAFSKYGVNIEGAGGKIRDPKLIIMDALKAAQDKSGGSLGTKFNVALGDMFASTKARQAIGSFESKFKDAGGGEAGLAAVSAEFERLRTAMATDAEISDSFARAMKTSNSQAEVFNNQIRKSALQMQQDLMPAMASLAEEIVPLVQTIASYTRIATGDKQLRNIQNAATEDVGNAVTRTGKQIEGGKISDAQIEENRVATNEAFEAKNRAAAELATARETLSRKTKGNEYSHWFRAQFENVSDDPNSFVGRVFGTSKKGDEARVKEKQEELRKAEENYEKMIQTNQDVKDRLDRQLLVRIENVEELRNAMSGGPPGLGNGGVGPSPEQKAGEQ